MDDRTARQQLVNCQYTEDAFYMPGLKKINKYKSLMANITNAPQKQGEQDSFCLFVM